MQVKLRIFSDLWLSTRKQNCRQIRKVNTCKNCKSLAEGVLLNLCNHKCGKQHLTEKWGKSTDSNHVVLLPHTFWGKNLWRGNPFNPSINIHVYYPVNSFSTTVKLRSALRCKKEQKLKSCLYLVKSCCFSFFQKKWKFLSLTHTVHPSPAGFSRIPRGLSSTWRRNMHHLHTLAWGAMKNPFHGGQKSRN